MQFPAEEPVNDTFELQIFPDELGTRIMIIRTDDNEPSPLLKISTSPNFDLLYYFDQVVGATIDEVPGNNLLYLPADSLGPVFVDGMRWVILLEYPL